MDSREFGLVAGQQLTGLEDLHYGLWEEGEMPSVLGIKEAQNRYTKLILDTITEYGGEPAATRILDVSCGTGVILKIFFSQRSMNVILKIFRNQTAITNTISYCSARVINTFP